MNNRRVDLSTERNSAERSMEKRKTLDSSEIIRDNNTSMRMDIASKIANARHERLDKSPVMKYLSISLVKENKVGSTTRNSSKNSIKFHNQSQSSGTRCVYNSGSRILSPKSTTKRYKPKGIYEVRKPKNKLEGKSGSRMPKPGLKRKEQSVRQGKITLYSSKYEKVRES